MRCPYCNRKPNQIHRYLEESKSFEMSPDSYVRMNVTTYDPETDMFCCQHCYLKLGSPLKKTLQDDFRRHRKTVLQFRS